MNLGMECIELIGKKMTGEIHHTQFCDALIDLNIRYPMRGHEPPMSNYQIKNHKNIKRVYVDPVNGYKYLDYTYPFNFDEAAQMYHWQTKKENGIDQKRLAAGEIEYDKSL